MPPRPATHPSAFLPPPITPAHADLLQLVGIVIDEVANLLEKLESPEVAASPAQHLQAVGGYFDYLLKVEARVPRSSTGSLGGAPSHSSGGGGAEQHLPPRRHASVADMVRGGEDDLGGPAGRSRRRSSGLLHPQPLPGGDDGGARCRRLSAPTMDVDEAGPSSTAAAAVPPPEDFRVRRTSTSMSLEHGLGHGRRRSSASSVYASPLPRSSSAADDDALGAAALSHHRVGVMGPDSVVRSTVSSMLAGAGAEVTTFDSPADLVLGSSVLLRSPGGDLPAGGGVDWASASIETVVVLLGPGMALSSLDELPFVTADGAPRRFLLVGDLDPAVEEEVFESDQCFIVRPIRQPVPSSRRPARALSCPRSRPPAVSLRRAPAKPKAACVCRNSPPEEPHPAADVRSLPLPFRSAPRSAALSSSPASAGGGPRRSPPPAPPRRSPARGFSPASPARSCRRLLRAGASAARRPCRRWRTPRTAAARRRRWGATIWPRTERRLRSRLASLRRRAGKPPAPPGPEPAPPTRTSGRAPRAPRAAAASVVSRRAGSRRAPTQPRVGRQTSCRRPRQPTRPPAGRAASEPPCALLDHPSRSWVPTALALRNALFAGPLFSLQKIYAWKSLPQCQMVGSTLPRQLHAVGSTHAPFFAIDDTSFLVARF